MYTQLRHIITAHEATIFPIRNGTNECRRIYQMKHYIDVTGEKANTMTLAWWLYLTVSRCVCREIVYTYNIIIAHLCTFLSVTKSVKLNPMRITHWWRDGWLVGLKLYTPQSINGTYSIQQTHNQPIYTEWDIFNSKSICMKPEFWASSLKVL